MIELGAGRFDHRKPPGIAALVDEIDLTVEPFSLRPSGRGNTCSSKEILEKVLDGSDRSTWHEVPFLELCRARLTSAALDTFLAEQGNDILFEPTLPTSEAVRIIDDHPETTSEGSAWLKFQTGFQELTRHGHREAVLAGATFAFETRVVRVVAMLVQLGVLPPPPPFPVR